MEELKQEPLLTKAEKSDNNNNIALEVNDTSANATPKNGSHHKKSTINTNKFDPETQKLNHSANALASILLTAPLIMGLCINTFGHQYSIDELVSKGDASVKKYIKGLSPWDCFFPIGGLVAAPSCSFIINRYGKKPPTIIFYIASLIGFTIKFSAMYTPYEVIFVGRFFDGIASGGLMVAGVSWMFDLLPRRIHQIHKALIQIFINLGIVLIGIFSLVQVRGRYWSYSYITQLVMTVFGLVGCIFLPESHIHEYTVERNRERLAKALKRLRGVGYDSAEVDDLADSIDRDSNIKQLSMRQFFREKRFLVALITTVLMNIFQQISGINVVVAFTAKILTGGDVQTGNSGSGELTSNDIKLIAEYSIYILLVGCVGSVIAAPFVGRFSRKPMLMIGFGGMTICFLISNFIQGFRLDTKIVVGLYSLFFFIFQFGPGPLVWFICIEIFPPDAVSSAQGVSTVANWFANSCVYLLYPIVSKSINFKAIFIFTAINAIAFLYVTFGVVETINKRSDQILKEYNNKYSWFTKHLSIPASE